MKVKFESSFARDLRRIQDRKLQERVGEAIQRFEDADTLFEIEGIRKLRDAQGAYRLRISEHRLGLLSRGDSVILVRFLDRKDIYRYFP